MLLVLFAVTVGLVVGYFRNGRAINLTNLEVQRPALAAISVFAYAIVEFFTPGSAGLLRTMVVVTTFVLIVVAASNYRVKGAGIIAFGLVLNLIVLVANQAIPVRLASLDAVGAAVSTTTEANGTISTVERLSSIQVLETATTKLAWLGDIIPIPLFRSVISFGDIIALAGLIVLVLNATGRRSGPEQGLPDYGDVSELVSPPTSRPPVARVAGSQPDRSTTSTPDQERSLEPAATTDRPPVAIDLTRSEAAPSESISPRPTETNNASSGYQAHHDSGELSVDELFGDYDRAISSISGAIDLRDPSDRAENAPKI